MDTLVGLGCLIESREVTSTGIAKHAYELAPQYNQKITEDIKNIQGVDMDTYEKLVRELDEKSTEELILESKHISQLYS